MRTTQTTHLLEGMIRTAIVLFAWMVGFGVSYGQSTQTNVFPALNLPIPDGNTNGMQDVRSITSDIVQITSVRVRLSISGEFNGDLYAILRHSSGAVTTNAVLLNRPGRTATNSLGYGDAGLEVTFDDAEAQDIHTYRDVTNPPAGSPLLGDWQPDARSEDPSLVDETSPRTAYLSGFQGMSADGQWTLFVADMDAGTSSTNSLKSWGLEIAGKVRPAVSWVNPADIVYGTALGDSQLNAAAEVSGSFAYDPPAGTVLPAGSNQTLSVAFTPDNTNLYAEATASVVLTVAPAVLSVTADNQSRPYGTVNPALTFSYSGFVNGHGTNVLSGAPVLTTTAETDSPAGDYLIEIALGSLLLINTNYAFALSNGTLTVEKAVSLPALISSTNPAELGALVTFTVSLTALPPTVGTPSGEVQFTVDGVDYGLPLTLTNGSASLDTTALAAGTRGIGAAYAGDGNFLGTTGLLDPAQFIISSPVATADVVPRVPNYLTRVPEITLLSNDTDADGDPLVLETVDTLSAAGGTLSRSNGWVFYTPPIGYFDDDSFQYVVRDAHDRFATGGVSVVLLADREAAARLSLVDLGEGTYRVISTGLPWGNYRVERTDDLSGTNWATLALGAADLWGDFEVEDLTAPQAPTRCYRSVFEGDGSLSLPFRFSMVSFPNPAPPGAPVTLRATLTLFTAGAAAPTGTVQFRADGVSHGEPATFVGSSASLETTNLTLGEHSIIAEYSGDENYQSAICTLPYPQIINTPPVVGADVIERDPFHGTKMLLSDLMANDVEMDGDPLVFDGLSATSAEGGTLSQAEGWIFYTPPAGFVGADSFTYRLRDDRGGTATATVAINPRVGTEPSANLSLMDLGGGSYRLFFSGVPWRIYSIEYTESLDQPNWQPVATNTADSHGLFVVEDTLPQGTTARFYRSVPQSVGATASPFRLAVWTNFIAHTNGRSMTMWLERSHPEGWPTNAPVLVWNPNCLLYGLDGFTGISQCNEFEGAPGQISVTALTKRHGYMRGHGQGECGLRTNHYAGKKVWFCTSSNTVVEMTVAADFIRNPDPTYGCSSPYDYGLVIFTEDLPDSITPVWAMSPADKEVYYWNTPDLTYLYLATEQEGHCAAGIEPFVYDIFKGGDSGSPNLIPSPDNKLIMFSGRGTGALSAQTQTDMDTLSVFVGINTNEYQLRWYDLSPWGP